MILSGKLSRNIIDPASKNEEICVKMVKTSVSSSTKGIGRNTFLLRKAGLIEIREGHWNLYWKNENSIPDRFQSKNESK